MQPAILEHAVSIVHSEENMVMAEEADKRERDRMKANLKSSWRNRGGYR